MSEKHRMLFGSAKNYNLKSHFGVAQNGTYKKRIFGIFPVWADIMIENIIFFILATDTKIYTKSIVKLFVRNHLGFKGWYNKSNQHNDLLLIPNNINNRYSHFVKKINKIKMSTKD